MLCASEDSTSTTGEGNRQMNQPAPEEEEEEEEEGQVLPVRQAGRADAKKKKTSNIVSLRSDEGVHKKSKHQL